MDSSGAPSCQYRLKYSLSVYPVTIITAKHTHTQKATQKQRVWSCHHFVSHYKALSLNSFFHYTNYLPASQRRQSPLKHRISNQQRASFISFNHQYLSVGLRRSVFPPFEQHMAKSIENYLFSFDWFSLMLFNGSCEALKDLNSFLVSVIPPLQSYSHQLNFWSFFLFVFGFSGFSFCDDIV